MTRYHCQSGREWKICFHPKLGGLGLATTIVTELSHDWSNFEVDRHLLAHTEDLRRLPLEWFRRHDGSRIDSFNR